MVSAQYGQLTGASCACLEERAAVAEKNTENECVQQLYNRDRAAGTDHKGRTQCYNKKLSYRRQTARGV